MKTGLRSNPLDPIGAKTESRAPSLRTERSPGDHRPRFWPRCGSRLVEWASQRKWLGGTPRQEQAETLEPFSGLRRLKESSTYKELQALVDDTQAAPDGELVHLVDLALFREADTQHAT